MSHSPPDDAAPTEAPRPPAEAPWWDSAFRSDYRRVYPHRDLESARLEVAYLLERGVAGRVLDLACGFGRHSLALRRAGLDVVGVDYSMDLLRDAPGIDPDGLLAGRLLRGDARRLPLAAGVFDSVVNLFSSFGYFGDEGDERVAAEIGRVLRPGGRAVMDLMNPARIRAGLVPESRTERDGIVLFERRALLDGGRRVTKEVLLELPGEPPRRWREDVRMYESAELGELLGRHGLGVERVEGDFQGGGYAPDAERQIAFVRRV